MQLDYKHAGTSRNNIVLYCTLHFLSSKVEEKLKKKKKLSHLLRRQMNKTCDSFLSTSQEIPELISEVGE